MRRTAWWVKPVNSMLGAITSLTPQSLETSFTSLQMAAARRTGLDAQGDEEFLSDFRWLHDCLLSAPEVSPLGRLIIQTDLGRRLKNRFRFRMNMKEHPDIVSTPIEKPIFIVGLPRTGTTFLHDTLGGLVGYRAPLLWELLRPDVPPRNAAELRHRIRRSQWLPRVTRWAVPIMQLIHPLDAMRPEECVFVLPHNLVFHTRARIPRYRDWFAARDVTGDYNYLRRQLQMLQWNKPLRRWVLKSPFHLWNLDALLGVFPDATLVWMHRAPEVALASWCSLVETIMSSHNHTVDLHQLGKDWLGMWADATARAMRARARHPGCFIDICYDGLVKEPVSTVERLLSRIGAGPAQNVTSQRDQEPGAHTYSLSRYGLTAQDVRAAFSEYLTNLRSELSSPGLP